MSIIEVIELFFENTMRAVVDVKKKKIIGQIRTAQIFVQ